ncbi:MAG TPA: hypothetical protein VGK45_05920, partial [Thermoanaerobaculia bacterium]
PAGSRWLGTFNREEAVERETLDFFATGHPLVEGILTELEEGTRGRVALLQVSAPGKDLPDGDVFGLLAFYKRGPGFEAVVVDSQGRKRPDLAAFLTAETLDPDAIDAKKWTGQKGWGPTIRRLAGMLPADEEPQAVAAFRIRRVHSVE